MTDNEERSLDIDLENRDLENHAIDILFCSICQVLIRWSVQTNLLWCGFQANSSRSSSGSLSGRRRKGQGRGSLQKRVQKKILEENPLAHLVELQRVLGTEENQAESANTTLRHEIHRQEPELFQYHREAHRRATQYLRTIYFALLDNPFIAL